MKVQLAFGSSRELVDKLKRELIDKLKRAYLVVIY